MGTFVGSDIFFNEDNKITASFGDGKRVGIGEVSRKNGSFYSSLFDIKGYEGAEALGWKVNRGALARLVVCESIRFSWFDGVAHLKILPSCRDGRNFKCVYQDFSYLGFSSALFLMILERIIFLNGGFCNFLGFCTAFARKSGVFLQFALF